MKIPDASLEHIHWKDVVYYGTTGVTYSCW